MKIERYMIDSIFSFFIRPKSSPDPLLPNILELKMEIIMIGRMKIQAFHKPNSKAGMSDTISLFIVNTINYLTLLA
jgi:hypothetical protein